MLVDRLGQLLDRPAIEHDSPEALECIAAAEALYTGWPAELAGLPETTRAPSTADLMATITVMLDVIAARPPELPCHGVAHTVRVLSMALDIAEADDLDEVDASRLFLAAAAHDLGRLILHRDAVLRHADISALLIGSLRAELGLAEGIFAPLRYAVLMHSARRTDRRPLTPRVIDDVRSADKYDALNEIGVIRAMLYTGAEDRVPMTPLLPVAAPHVLYGWWKNILHPEPVSVSRHARRLIKVALVRNRALGESLDDLRGDPARAADLFLAAADLVEPDANPAALAAAATRLAGRPLRQRVRWAGLLDIVFGRIERLEADRAAIVTAGLASERPERAALARLLADYRMPQATDEVAA